MASTYLLTNNYHFHPVISSCLITLLLSFIPRIGSKPTSLALCFIGSFVGMSGQILNFLDFLILSALVLIVVFLFRNKFIGFGGKMGKAAFISSVVYFLFIKATR